MDVLMNCPSKQLWCANIFFVLFFMCSSSIGAALEIMKSEMYVNIPLHLPSLWMCAAGKPGVT